MGLGGRCVTFLARRFCSGAACGGLRGIGLGWGVFICYDSVRLLFRAQHTLACGISAVEDFL